MRCIRTILFLAAISCAMQLAAQPGYIFNVKRLNVKNGLVHQEVNVIFQDSRGLIWVGTRFGLSRYDGYEFKSYTREKNGLSNNSIGGIVEDDSHRLWLFYTTERRRDEFVPGIDLLNPEDGTVTNITKQFPTLPFDAKKIQAYFSSPKKELFFFAGNRLWKYTPATGFTGVDIPAGFAPLACFGGNGFWGKMNGQYARYTGNNIEYAGTANETDMPVCTGENNKYLYTTPFTRSAVMLRWIGQPPPMPYNIPLEFTSEHPIVAHVDEQKKIIWIAWQRDLLAFDINGNMIYRLASNREEPVERVITSLFTDRTGITWVATQAGILLVECKREQFTRYLYTDPLNNTPGKQFYQCRGIATTGSWLLVNTYKGDFRVNLATGEKDSIIELMNNGVKFANRFPIYQDANGVFYSGANVLIRFDPVTGKELKYFAGERKRFWSICRDEHGDMLLGTASGLCIAYNNTDSIVQFKQLNRFAVLDSATILQIVKGRNGQTWLVSNTGLFIYDKAKGITERYSTQGSGKYHLPSDNIQHLYIDRNNIHWLATEGSGLIMWNMEQGTWKMFTRANGLSSNNIYAVYEDKKGFLWMSSDYGIMRMNRQTGQVITYTTDDGLAHYEFNRISHYQSPDGRLYFGGLNGVTAFYPEMLDEENNDAGPGVTVAELQQYIGKKGNLEDYTGKLLRNGKIVLQPSDKFFILKLATPEYMHSDKTVFFYKIEGLDKEWIRSNNNSIRVGRLPYGNFTLVIRAQSGNGNMTPETRIPIQVVRPFYLRWWFFVSSALAVILATRFYFRWRIQHLKNRKKELETTVAARTQELQRDKATIQQQAEELKQLDEMKSKFFANVSHELRTPLTLLAGPVDRLLKQSAEQSKDHAYLKLMQQNVQQLQNRVNEILDLSKLDGGKLELKEKPVQLEKLMQPVIASFESLAQQKGISFLYRNRTAQDHYLLLDAEQLKKILNNLLSNAFRFTPSGGQILVTLTSDTGMIIFKVSDTGEGIHPDEQQYVFNRFYQSSKGSASIQGGTGIGLALTSELVALMKGRITLESEPGTGSTFIVQLPQKIVPAPDVQTIITEQPVMTYEEPLPAMHRGQNNGATLLLAEDNLSLQQYIRLELNGFNVIIANNGAEALMLLEEAKELPGLVISDIMMPVMDGFTLLERIKSSERFRKIPVIMLTARTDIQDRLKALRIGVDDYLVKPFVTEELIARVHNLLRRQQARSDMEWIQADEPGDNEPAEATPIQQPSSAWLKQLEETIGGYLDRQEQFTLDMLAEKISLSKRQMQRNIKEETGLNANNYIREIRLHRARHYLENKTFATLNEVSFAVGFNDPHYFSSLFTERYGKKPVDYLV